MSAAPPAFLRAAREMSPAASLLLMLPFLGVLLLALGRSRLAKATRCRRPEHLELVESILVRQLVLLEL